MPIVHSLSLVFLTLTLALAVQAPEERDLSLRAPHVATGDEVPRIDGVLDEAFWNKAVVATDFIQFEPRAGEPATQKTEVLVTYTEDTLLIGARLFDTEPDRIVGTEYRRDALLEAEDSFEVFLDTFRDGRNAFYFATNPVGARLDGLMRNEGSVLNFDQQFGEKRINAMLWRKTEASRRRSRYNPHRMAPMGHTETSSRSPDESDDSR